MSASTAVAQAFVDAWHGKHADGTLGTLDVWDGSLHEFDGAALHAKYAALSGDDPTPEHEAPQSACPRAALPRRRTRHRHCRDVAARRSAEHARILAAKLRGALVADAVRGRLGVRGIGEHQVAGLE